MNEESYRFLTFFQRLWTDAVLQSRFVADPIGAMQLAGIMDPRLPSTEVMQGTRLFFYLTGSSQLRTRLASLGQQYPRFQESTNALTVENINIGELQRANYLLATDRTWQTVFSSQVYTLISDDVFRKILNIHIPENEISVYSQRLANDLITGIARGDERPDVVVLNLNVGLNANALYNVNVFANLNLNTNANANCFTNIDGVRAQDCPLNSQMLTFLTELSHKAALVAQQERSL